jgi:hypothetical protein
MKRLNPLYIILLFVTFAFLSFYTSSNQKEAYIEKLNEVKNLQIKALEFRNLVNTWRNEKYINSTLDEILRSQIFANQQITRTSTKEAIKIRIHSVNPQVLDTFLNKILNKQLIIKKLELNTNFIDLEVGSK